MSWNRGWNRGWSYPAYVSVGDKLSKATKHAAALAKKQGRAVSPVKPQGRKISNTFWGKGWCDHLDGMSDFASRLTRGATYLRNGSVVDLVIKPGRVESIVAGSEPYEVSIEIDRLQKPSFEALKKQCTGSIRSLIDLLAGKLEESVIKHLTHAETGMFPKPKQIRMKCSCPDFASVCKHIAAVFYAIGCKLDREPELLFVLREVDHKELIGIEALAPTLANDPLLQGEDALGGADLGALFGIEIDSGEAPPKQQPVKPNRDLMKPNRARTKKSEPITAAASPPKKVAKDEAKTASSAKSKKVAISKKTPRVKPVSAKERSHLGSLVKEFFEREKAAGGASTLKGPNGASKKRPTALASRGEPLKSPENVQVSASRSITGRSNKRPGPKRPAK